MCVSTSSAAWVPISPADRAELRKALRPAGLAVTPQREAVYEAVLNCGGHICAEHILEFLKERRPLMKINKTTVYRNLHIFVQTGLVIEHNCGDRPAQYEPATHGSHCHIICAECGKMTEIDNDIVANLRQSVGKRHRFVLDPDLFPLKGICGECARRG